MIFFSQPNRVLLPPTPKEVNLKPKCSTCVAAFDFMYAFNLRKLYMSCEDRSLF